MNVYDFDQTIYYPDSSYHFFLFCLKRYPLAVLPVIPGSVRLAVRYRRGQIDAKPLKEKLFSFLPSIKDPLQTVRAFWASHEKNLQIWYLQQKKEDDLIVSASPDFLLRPLAEKIGVALIATPMDPGTGRIIGENCHDREKVRRFREQYPDASIDEFYSDSLSDAPLAELAGRAFLIKRGDRRPWPKTTENKQR